MAQREAFDKIHTDDVDFTEIMTLSKRSIISRCLLLFGIVYLQDTGPRPG